MTDDELRERLAKFPQLANSGLCYRSTLIDRNPLVSSYRGGRWMARDATAVLYSSQTREGALAEMAFRLGQNTPLPQISVKVHKLNFSSARSLKLTRSDLESLGVNWADFSSPDYQTTQRIGIAAFQIGATSLEVPSARWPTENLVIVDESAADTSIALVESEVVDWIDWARKNTPDFITQN